MNAEMKLFAIATAHAGFKKYTGHALIAEFIKDTFDEKYGYNTLLSQSTF